MPAAVATRPTRRAFLGACAGAAAASATATASAIFAPAIERFRQEHHVPGISIAVSSSRAAELLYHQAFGYADQETSEVLTTGHLFRIASISKPVTSAAIYHLFEQRALDLDWPVFGEANGILREYDLGPSRPLVEQIRVRHLLTHTVGGWGNATADPMFQHPQLDVRQLIAWTLAHQPLTVMPGQQYAYSNFGYCLLGRVLERLTGKTYEEQAASTILQPTGAAQMRLAPGLYDSHAPNEVKYYGATAEDNPYRMNVLRMDSHGGWLATAADLVRFATGLSSVLRPATMTEMLRPTAANPHYASGWGVNEFHNRWHLGSLPGTSAVLVRTGRGLCWAALANSRESSGKTSEELDALLWTLVRAVPGWLNAA